MKLLLLTPQLPFPPHKGTALRNIHLLRWLAARHHVTLLSFVEEAPAPHDLKTLGEASVEVYTVPKPKRSLRKRLLTALSSFQPDMAFRLVSSAFSLCLEQLLKEEDFDAVQIEGIELAPYLLQGRQWRSHRQRPLLVFDEHNCEYLLQRRAFEVDRRYLTRWLAASYSLFQWRKLVRYEQQALLAADAVIAVSEVDGLALQKLVRGLNPIIVPNGVEVDAYRRPPKEVPGRGVPPLLLFTGSMDFRPNIDAVRWFCADILPLLWHEFPEVTFAIVGRNPGPAVTKLEEPRVRVAGAVPDTRPYLWHAAAYVAPLRMGSGMRFKALEALAAGVPVVSTSLGVEGIAAEDGRHLLLADTPAAFAQALGRLLRDPDLCERLTQEGLELVKRYDWQAILPRLDAVYQELETRLLRPAPSLP